jgi:hypothetical protein
MDSEVLKSIILITSITIRQKQIEYMHEYQESWVTPSIEININILLYKYILN